MRNLSVIIMSHIDDDCCMFSWYQMQPKIVKTISQQVGITISCKMMMMKFQIDTWFEAINQHKHKDIIKSIWAWRIRIYGIEEYRNRKWSLISDQDLFHWTFALFLRYFATVSIHQNNVPRSLHMHKNRIKIASNISRPFLEK